MVQEGSRRFKRVQKGYRGYTEYGILLGPSKTRWKGPKCIQVGSKIVQRDLRGPKCILVGTKVFQIDICKWRGYVGVQAGECDGV